MKGNEAKHTALQNVGCACWSGAQYYRSAKADGVCFTEPNLVARLCSVKKCGPCSHTPRLGVHAEEQRSPHSIVTRATLFDTADSMGGRHTVSAWQKDCIGRLFCLRKHIWDALIFRDQTTVATTRRKQGKNIKGEGLLLNSHDTYAHCDCFLILFHFQEES